MKKLVFLLVLVFLAYSLTLASENGAATNVKQIADIMLEQEQTIIAEQIQFADAEAQRFWPIFEAYQADSRKLLLKMITLLQRFHAQPAPRSGEWSRAAINDIIDIETEKLSLRKTYVNKLGEVLPPEKLLNLMIVGGTIEVGFILKFMSETPLLQ